MMISSAPNVRSASSIACSGLASPTSPEASMPSERSRSRLASRRSCAARASSVLVGGPVAQSRVERGRADEDHGLHVAAALLDQAPQLLSSERLVRDDEDPALPLRHVDSDASAVAGRRFAPVAHQTMMASVSAMKTMSAAQTPPARAAIPIALRYATAPISSRNASASLRNGLIMLSSSPRVHRSYDPDGRPAAVDTPSPGGATRSIWSSRRRAEHARLTT